MKRLKIRVFASGKLTGEGYLGVLSRGSVGKKLGCDVISPVITQKIKIQKNILGKLIVKCRRDSLREVVIDGVHIDRHLMIKLGILKSYLRSERGTLPAKSLIKLTFEGFELFVTEEVYEREAVTDGEVETVSIGEFRRRPFSGDTRFLVILTASIFCYTSLHTTVLLTKTPRIDIRRDIPRRFTRFIYEAPLPTSRELKQDISRIGENKGEKREEKKETPEEATVKPEVPETKGKGDTPALPDRNKIREKIARKGILGVLTGRGSAGTRYSENLLNRVDEISTVGVKVADVDRLDNPIGKGGGSLIDPNISALIDESKLGTEKEFKNVLYKTETGTEMEISGDIDDKERSAQVISSVISTYLGGIKYVYNRELRHNPNLAGKITVSFIINPDGSVESASIEESNVNWAQLEEQVLKRIKHWKFPPSKSGKIRIVFPFLFFPSM